MNGLRIVMLRGLEEHRAIFVERALDGLRRAWFGRLMRWRTSVVLQSMTWKRDEYMRRRRECQVCMDEDEEGCERHQEILIVTTFAFAVQTSPSNASSPISLRVGAPHGSAPLATAPSSSFSTRMGRLMTPWFASGSPRVHYSYVYSVGGLSGPSVRRARSRPRIHYRHLHLYLYNHGLAFDFGYSERRRRRIGRRRRAGERVTTCMFGSCTHQSSLPPMAAPLTLCEIQQRSMCCSCSPSRRRHARRHA